MRKRFNKNEQAYRKLLHMRTKAELVDIICIYAEQIDELTMKLNMSKEMRKEYVNESKKVN